MERFRTDNTEGYNERELNELNKRYRLACMTVDPDDLCDKWLRDSISKRVLTEFDLEARFTIQ